MTLAPPGVRHDPSLEKAKPASKGPKPLFRNKQLLKKGEIGSYPIRKSSIALKGVKDSSKGSGATPAGVARTTPAKTGTTKQYLLEHKRPSRDSGATVEGVSKGYPDRCS